MTSIAAERNKLPLLKVLQNVLHPNTHVLEIASGTGQHVIYFASRMPAITFQPTEINDDHINNMNVAFKKFNLSNINYAEYLNVLSPTETWLSGKIQPQSFDTVLNINMTHITDFSCTEALFRGAAYALKPGGMLFTYGPFSRNGTISPDSNVQFDRYLKSQNPCWGLRDVENELINIANKNNLVLEQVISMPANNFSIIWRKKAN